MSTNKRNKTLRSFYSPAPTPVIPSRQPNQPSVQVQQEIESVVQTQEVATRVRNVNVGAENIETDRENVETERDNMETERGSNDPNVTLNDADIVADPGLRVPIENLHPNLRDAARRAYILKGPCQPKGHNYPRRTICGRKRSFQEDWFEDNPWLEYSVDKDAAYCFYCYLFKHPTA
jgi:hypothetical protein